MWDSVGKKEKMRDLLVDAVFKRQCVRKGEEKEKGELLDEAANLLRYEGQPSVGGW